MGYYAYRDKKVVGVFVRFHCRFTCVYVLSPALTEVLEAKLVDLVDCQDGKPYRQAF
jgi:hypothetical protein